MLIANLENRFVRKLSTSRGCSISWFRSWISWRWILVSQLIARSCVLIFFSCLPVVQFCGLASVSLEVQDSLEFCLPGSWESLGHKPGSESPSRHNCGRALVATTVNHSSGVPRLQKGLFYCEDGFHFEYAFQSAFGSDMSHGRP